jgi:SAM-dependent methyltransferase
MSNKPQNSKDEKGKYGKSWNPSEYYQDTNIAESYDAMRFSTLAGRIFNRLEKRRIQQAFGGLSAGSHILDCPCGTGRLAETLLELGYCVTGVDISQPMLDVALRKLSRFGGRFQARLGDVRKLERMEGQFSGAICARLLMHFPFDEQTEILRSIATTAPFIVFTHGLSTPYHNRRRQLKGLLGHQRPAAFPISRLELSVLLTSAMLQKVSTDWILPFVSEAIVVVAKRRSN